MAINTIIFDFDGTVVNTNQVVINSWQHTYKTITGHEYPVGEIIKTFGEPLSVSMKNKFPNNDVEELVKIYRGYQVNHFKDMIELFPGMRELIVELKEQSYNIAIVTSRTRETTIKGLSKYQLNNYIDMIVSCDDTDRHKPDPEPVFIVLKKFGIESNEAIMIGDSMFDIKCAHNAGMEAVLVDWAIAVSDEDKMGDDAPEHIIKKASDLFKII